MDFSSKAFMMPLYLSQAGLTNSCTVVVEMRICLGIFCLFFSGFRGNNLLRSVDAFSA